MDLKLYPQSTDSHTHIIEMRNKGIDVDFLFDEAFSAGLLSVMDVAVDEKHFIKRLEYKKKYKGIYLSAGVHPNNINNIDKQLMEITKQIQSGEVSAIGETGLDFHWETIPVGIQKKMLAAHINLSKIFNLPLIIHNRLADKEILEILQSEKAEKGVIHCFSSNYHFAQKFVDLGFYISFAGNISYKRSEIIREAASYIPLDKILVETDAPYLAPQKKRGKLNHPGYIGYTIDIIADIFHLGADEIAALTTKNFQDFINGRK